MKSKDISISFGACLLMIPMLLVSGCWTSVKDDHPLVQKTAGAPHARVYFIRPRTERFMGMADNRVDITLNNQPLLVLVKGEYTYIDLIPGKVEIAVTNQTTYGPAHKIKTETRARMFTFRPGQTYFIAVTPIDGEFRGVHFLPKSIDQAEARKLAVRARGVGSARWKPFPGDTST